MAALDASAALDPPPAASARTGGALAYALLASFFAISLALRPVIPIDETRYLSVAWEMWLRRDFLVPTVNFAPYFQKPPLLFWLIDLSWLAFGVGRAAALVPIYAAAAAVVYLTGRLAAALLPEDADVGRRASWLIAGNLVFLAYSSFVLFDILLTACALGSILALLSYARSGALRHAAVAGLLAGMGVLAKGPVVFIHIAWPAALLPVLMPLSPALMPRSRGGGAHPRAKAVGVWALCALLPAAAWLVPLAGASDRETLRGLLWLQSAGRVTGSLEDAHARPFYFYLPLLPIFAAPWFALGGFWKEIGSSAPPFGAASRPFRFAAFWTAGVVATFSAISGKQPHYLVPILPPVTIMLACLLRRVTTRRLQLTALVSLVLLSASQLVARFTLFPANDLAAVVRLMTHQDGTGGKEWAVTDRYLGELNFLARLEAPLTVIKPGDAAAWLAGGRSRRLVDLNGKVEGSRGVVLEQPYRRTRLRVFRGGHDAPPAAGPQPPAARNSPSPKPASAVTDRTGSGAGRRPAQVSQERTAR